jgi:nicotinate-nucleotide adenylyltransferase
LTAIKKIGVFGGTFDPIHLGHTYLVSQLLELHLFTELIVIPAGDPWQKTPGVSKQDRLAMVKLAMENLPITVSEIEVNRSGPSYAVDTAAEIFSQHNPCEITWIAGSDVISNLSSWHEIEKLATLVEFLFITRPGSELASELIPSYIKYRKIEIAALDISATKVRAAIANRDDVSKLIPAKVAKFIESKGLYGAA